MSDFRARLTAMNDQVQAALQEPQLESDVVAAAEHVVEAYGVLSKLLPSSAAASTLIEMVVECRLHDERNA